MRSHVAAEPARTACASSPASVNDCVGHRRAIARHCIGERSWASSTTTWPYCASAGRTAGTSSYVELVGELLVHAVQLVGGGVTHERGRGVRGLALPAVQPVAAGRLAGQVLERAPAPWAVGQPLLQDPLGHVVERPSRARRRVAGASGRARAGGRPRRGGRRRPRSIRRSRSLEACSASSSSGVRMSRPAFARRRGDARRRRTSTLGREQRPDGVERLRERAAVDHVEERRRVPDRFRTDAADPEVAFEAVVVRGVERAQEKSLDQRPAAVVRRRPSPRGRDDGREARRARPRGGTDPPTARCRHGAPARGPGSPGRGRRPCGGRL